MEFGAHLDRPMNVRAQFNELPIRAKLLMTLWWIGNQETFRQVADRFGTTRGNAHYIIMKTCEIIAERINDYVVWPSRDELWNESRGFRLLPHVIGVLDATDIEIKQPLNDLAAYTTKDGLTAVKVIVLI